MLFSCSFLSAQEEEGGFIITIQDDEQQGIENEHMRILDEKGNVVGTFVSKEDGVVEVPLLKVGDYHLELAKRRGYRQKEAIALAVTDYNQKGTMEMIIVMDRDVKKQTTQHPSLLLLFLCLLNACAYLIIYGVHKESFQEFLRAA